VAARRAPWSRLVEHIRPPATDLYVFGAGHVGRALVNVAEALPFRLHWRDTRPELGGSDPRLVAGGDLLPVIAAARAGSYFVVLTHAHEIDYQAVRAILRRADAGYCGLIGSATKRARFVSRLTRDGLAAGGLTCPIGGGMIRSKLPAAIAVATSLELLQRLEAQASSASNANVASQCSPM
jgi:xanthine dehydrogenase accessory factor